MRYLAQCGLCTEGVGSEKPRMAIRRNEMERSHPRGGIDEERRLRMCAETIVLIRQNKEKNTTNSDRYFAQKGESLAFFTQKQCAPTKDEKGTQEGREEAGEKRNRRKHLTREIAKAIFHQCDDACEARRK